MIKTRMSALKQPLPLPLFLCFMIFTSAYGKGPNSIRETVSSISALGKVCDYKRLPDNAKNQILKSAFSMMPRRDQAQVGKGLSNYIVFLQDTQNQFEKRCSDKAKNQQLCANLPRRSKTFYKVDVVRGVKKIESYVSHSRPQIKKVLAHCSNPDEVVDSALGDLRNKTDILDDLQQANFEKALGTMKGLAKDLAIEVRDKRVANPIKKRLPHTARTVYDDSVIASDTCHDEAEKSVGLSALTSNLLNVAQTITDLFTPNEPKSFSVVDK